MRSIKNIALLLLIWSVVAGCVTSELEGDQIAINLGAPEQILASSESAMSRTSVQDGKYVCWSEGDGIAISLV